MTHAFAVTWIVTGLCTGLVACGNDTTRDCSQVPAACDITKADCQTAVLQITACERGNAVPKTPPMRVIDESEFKKELETEAQKSMVDTRWDDALAALQLMPPDSSVLNADINVTVNATAAYYDPEVKRVSIIRSALDTDPTNNMFTLSHELTHYLQDLDFGLIAFDEKYVHTTDQSVATTALIEGDAVVTSTRVYTRFLGLPSGRFDWSQFEVALNKALANDLAMSDSPLATVSLELPYNVGSLYVEEAWSERRDKVDALFKAPPLSVIDLLGAVGAPTRIEKLDCGLPEAPAGFTLAAVDSLGYTGAFALLQAAHNADAVIAGELRGDAIGVYPADDQSGQKGVVAWRLRFDKEDTLQTFSNSIAGLGLVTRSFGREILITTGKDRAQNPLTGDALNACPPLSTPGDQNTMVQNSALRRLRPMRR